MKIHLISVWILCWVLHNSWNPKLVLNKHSCMISVEWLKILSTHCYTDWGAHTLERSLMNPVDIYAQVLCRKVGLPCFFTLWDTFMIYKIEGRNSSLDWLTVQKSLWIRSSLEHTNISWGGGDKFQLLSCISCSHIPITTSAGPAELRIFLPTCYGFVYRAEMLICLLLDERRTALF
jgi:hypothetical protein